MRNKKILLDILYYDIGRQQYDFWLCGMKKIDGKVISTKWRRYSELCFEIEPKDSWKIDWINNRSILPNEIVLDIEDNDEEKIINIVKRLKDKKGIVAYVYATGSRGYHIHIFLRNEIDNVEKKIFIDLFGADIMKANTKTMIALEYTPHWKTGKIKKLIGVIK